jgi:hypothetical protein
VIWVATMITFFGTIVAVMLLFFLYSESESTRDTLRKTGATGNADVGEGKGGTFQLE